MTISKSALRDTVFLIVSPIFLGGSLWSQQSAVPALPADIPANADRYSFLLMGNLAGQQAVWIASDGTLHIFYQFNDRGRGPKTTSILKLDPSGLPLSEVITGNDYLKSNLDPRLLLPSQGRTLRNCAPGPRRAAKRRKNRSSTRW
jgi:hypothetical protein